MRPIRSLLFAPANRPELLRKFPRFAADAVAIDLEDGTPNAEKESAREALPEIVGYLRAQGLQSQIFVRTNAPGSKYVEQDLNVALTTSVDGIMMPKLETAAELERFDAALTAAEKRGSRPVALIGMIETARGVVHVESFGAKPNSHLAALAFGAEDFITDISGRRTPEGLEVLYARSRVLVAARAGGLEALDQVFVDIRDDEAFLRDAEMGRQLGYGGKMCLVPRQIEIANAVFSPSTEEIDRSRRLISAYSDAQAEGRGTIEFEGTMVDEPLLKRARAILQLAGIL